MREPGWVVLKFGGTSVASVDGWSTIEAAVREVIDRGDRAMVVCSALAGVSTAIEAAIDSAAGGGTAEAQVALVRRAHLELAAALGMPLPSRIAALNDELVAGLARAQVACRAPLRATLMGLGERMSTEIGAAWLRSRGLEARWLDARELLVAVDGPDVPESRRFLSAEVRPARGPGWLEELTVAITQGFVASNDAGETVLLGRGGSDTSAAMIGVLLQASRVEIWTDVPGLFTANPRDLADARLLSRLGYDEAETMAALGARVLHPRTIRPLRDAGIPLQVRSTFRPGVLGTLVDAQVIPGVKAVTSRSGLVVVRMGRPPSWQPVGFLAEVSTCFQRHGLSIDLIATSAGLVTATIDPQSAPHFDLDDLRGDLDRICDVELEAPLASVSLVGTGLRSELPRLGAALAATYGVRVHFVTQGASDHHLTLVVDEVDREALVERLHTALFHEEAVGGPTWRWIEQHATEVAA